MQIILSPMATGQPLQIQIGQKLRISFSFSYKVAETTTIPVWASLYRYTAGILDRSSLAQTKGSITLDRAIDRETLQGQVDIAVGNVSPGLWGLILEVPGFEGAQAKIDDSIEVVPAPGMTEWITPMITIAMLGMMAQMIPTSREMAEETE